MKRTVLIGSVIVCFLMLMIPNISAIEYSTFKRSGPDFDEEELILAILERIEELQKTNPNPKICLWGGDPDGPFEGGLDDLSDWGDFTYAAVQTVLLTFLIPTLPDQISLYIDLITSGELESMIFGFFMIFMIIFDLTVVPKSVLENYGDAFDIIDPDGNGS